MKFPNNIIVIHVFLFIISSGVMFYLWDLRCDEIRHIETLADESRGRDKMSYDPGIWPVIAFLLTAIMAIFHGGMLARLYLRRR